MNWNFSLNSRSFVEMIRKKILVLDLSTSTPPPSNIQKGKNKKDVPPLPSPKSPRLERLLDREDVPPPPLSPLLSNLFANIPERMPFLCEWKGCGKPFKTANQVYYHAVTTHCPENIPELPCEWGKDKEKSENGSGGRCDSTIRRRFSLMHHLQTQHCTADNLQQAIYRRINAAAKENKEKSESNAVVAAGVIKMKREVAQALNFEAGELDKTEGNNRGSYHVQNKGIFQFPELQKQSPKRKGLKKLLNES